ncbi:4,5-DOPA-extradiol-dioxygenase [Flavobacterium gawalongense]|uniref:4,5-DOPA dioxygenase extradiol n=1 Tax=Flavobacterium gawalongense TaxID=2594432 RepID=A0A553BSN6_9FLAO|nr:4,5-DOPA dioxygenase extradiol [Flavobacterium gawalongense]TRX03733.1 4,5-DOPA dioxygenase extradiol [Flavobacterium gawalongense]TRX08880.1 4,5-DOPA dioxygenase extradiol [Flavobacterium gawalongense]TRX11255.1 4,5-DOPA dioxygenase extradiol [Flavobacterium gawalongense]TRX12284.1 4,5-DOPA dioxygenase extradiol [Flavobacterium gawalongense]TRX30177.1 4,5-DOPA dioxygenase extradiol [Flavobacterium gawalongense]
MQLSSLKTATNPFSPTERMPVLFLGHGNPMNALTNNSFTQGFQQMAKTLPKPRAILCISAHWETKGTFVTAMQKPETIHDFGGFPQALFDVQYPAPGSPELALETQKLITSTSIGLSNEWGLDHGCWTVLKFLYPNAEIPIVEMSIDYTKPTSYHYELGKELAALRRKGVLIVGSGNSVHNLQLAAWDKMMLPGYAYEWAHIANEKIKKMILENDHQSLINFDKQGREFQLAVPTPEHYIPMLYTLALREKDEKATVFNDAIVAGSLNMLSIKIDKA